ncbi:MAG: hypothetical protein EOR29_33165, partial [Mesorhizobium sp.]
PAPGTILSIPQALKLAHEPVADCARYDSLRRTNSHGTHRGTGTDGSAEALRDCAAPMTRSWARCHQATARAAQDCR